MADTWGSIWVSPRISIRTLTLVTQYYPISDISTNLTCTVARSASARVFFGSTIHFQMADVRNDPLDSNKHKDL